MAKVSKSFEDGKRVGKKLLRRIFVWAVAILLAIPIAAVMLLLWVLTEIGDQAYHARKWMERKLEEAKKWAKSN